MSVLLLQLSDPHFGTEREEMNGRKQLLMRCIFKNVA